MKLPRCALLLLTLFFLPLGAHAATPPTITEPKATVQANGRATLSAKITANGAFTTVTFRYWRDAEEKSTLTLSTSADAVERLVEAPLESLVGGATYQFRVIAQNSAGRVRTPSPDQSFELPPYAPALSTRAPKKVAGGAATLRGVVTMNGTTGRARFEYGLTTSYGTEVEAVDREGNPIQLTGESINVPVFAPVTSLERNKTYQYRLFIEDDAGTRIVHSPNASFSTANVAPTAAADEITITGLEPVVIDVLKNDEDLDADRLKIIAITSAEAGSATKSRGTIIYTPGSGFRGFDTFMYTVEDAFGLRATATVTVRSPISAVTGWRGGLIQDAEGEVVGAFRITATATGSFTGEVEIDGEDYNVRGVLDVNGRFRGHAFDEDDALAVEFQVLQEAEGATIKGFFGDGRWTSSAEVSQFTLGERVELAGWYTVQLPAVSGDSGSGDDEDGALPQGDGWISVKVTDYGEIQLKGKTGDGRDFSSGATLGVVEGQPAVSFYATPDNSVLSGTLILGQTVTGQLAWSREETDATYYPEGFDLTLNAAGEKYIPPESGVRALEIDEAENDLATITISGGDVPSVTHALRISEDDKVTVLDPGFDALNLELDRRTGIFKGKFRFGDDRERRAKITGVLMQSQGVGHGVFLGFRETGKVEITVGSRAAPAPAPVLELSTPPDPDEADFDF